MIALPDFASLESPLYEPLDPAIHVDARDRDPMPELERQARTVAAISREFGVAAVAIRNAGKRGMKAWNQAKKEGVRWGFPDLIVPKSPELVALIEMKNGIKMPEQHQIDWLNALHRRGFPVGVFRRADSAVAWLKARGF